MRTLPGYRSTFAAVLASVIVGYAPGVKAALLSADRYSVAPGQGATLTWNSPKASHCRAGGAWSGLKSRNGTHRTGPLLVTSRFVIACLTPRGWVKERVTIAVGQSAPQNPAIKPTLQLKASSNTVRSGASVTLNWSGQGVSNCQATGAWTGRRASTGSEVRNSVTKSQSFTLTCDSPSGKLMAMTSVQVSSGGTRVTWVPPRYSIDGKPLSDLAAYRIYIGTLSRQYYDQIELANPAATEYLLDLEPGRYFIAMTAIDTEGNESSLSNEVTRIVQ